jgi:hypothetical protein
VTPISTATNKPGKAIKVGTGKAGAARPLSLLASEDAAAVPAGFEPASSASFYSRIRALSWAPWAASRAVHARRGRLPPLTAARALPLPLGERREDLGRYRGPGTQGGTT